MSAYINHLVEANEIQAIFASEDILSETDELLFKQGSELDHDSLVNLGQSQLKCPLEDEIELEDEFTPETLMQALLSFIRSDANFAAIYYLCDLEKELTLCVEALCQYKILRQKLTVLAIQLPNSFEESLFCSWMAVTVYARHSVPQTKLNHVFIAGACHDLGLLDIPPEIIFNSTPLSTEQWRKLKRHPIYSAKIMRALDIPDKGCIRAILEHHEQSDGTGYPYAKFEKQLTPLGRLLHMLGGAHAIYRKYFKVRQRTLHDMIPVLQMSILTQGGTHTNIVVELFKATNTTAHCTITEENIPAAVARLKQSVSAIKLFIDMTEQFRKEIGVEHKQLSLLGIQKTARMIRATLSNCGIINDAYLRWLDQVKTESLQFAYRELEDVILMTQEIEFHIQRYLRQLNSLAIAEKDGNFKMLLGSLSENLNYCVSELGVAEDLLK